MKRPLAHRLRTTGLGAVKCLVLQPRQNGFNLIATPVHFLNQAVKCRQGFCAEGLGEELIFFSGHIFQERFLGDSVEAACTYTADELSSENTGTESMDKCTEPHSISCISPEI